MAIQAPRPGDVWWSRAHDLPTRPMTLAALKGIVTTFVAPAVAEWMNLGASAEVQWAYVPFLSRRFLEVK